MWVGRLPLIRVVREFSFPFPFFSFSVCAFPTAKKVSAKWKASGGSKEGSIKISEEKQIAA